MRKRVIAFALACCLALCLGCGAAAAAISTKNGEVCLQDSQETWGSTEILLSGTSAGIILPVSIYYAGSSVAHPMRINGGTIQYQFYVFKDDDSGRYIGCNIPLNATWPQISMNSDTIYNPVLDSATLPTPLFQGGDTYSVRVAGGIMTITYNKEIYYGYDGEIDHVVQGTYQCTHNYTVTGP